MRKWVLNVFKDQCVLSSEFITELSTCEGLVSEDKVDCDLQVKVL